jgi:Ca2+-binding RTX toxin-like protein
MSIQAASALPNVPVLNGNVVLENAANGTEIGRITVSDPDGDPLRVSIVDAYGNTDLNSPFALVYDAPSGTYKLVVRDSSRFDYETVGGTLNVRIKVSDATGSRFQDFTINVADVNEAPTDITLSHYSVNEGAPAGQFVAYLGGSDPDAGDALTYELADAATSPFQIVRNAAGVWVLQVRDGSLIDFETDPDKLIDVTVIARDKNGLAVEKTFVLNINDMVENRAPTDIEISSDMVHENAANGAVVGTLSTLDPDAGDTFTYTLLDDAGGRFYIDSGVVKVRDGLLLDFEDQRTHNIKVLATDSHGASVEKTIRIDLLNVHSETVIGDARDNLILAGPGNDYLSGGAGDDTIDGGQGINLLFGGSGRDAFAISRGTSVHNTIADFVVGEDTLLLSARAFRLEAYLGDSLPENMFHLGSSSSAGLFTYDVNTGNLFFSWGEAGPSQFVATFTNRPSLSHDDFLIIA